MIKNEILHGYRLYGGASLQVYEVRRETYEITFGFRLAKSKIRERQKREKAEKREQERDGEERERERRKRQKERTEKKEDRKRIKRRKGRERVQYENIRFVGCKDCEFWAFVLSSCSPPPLAHEENSRA